MLFIPIEYGTKSIVKDVSGYHSSIIQIRNSLSSSLLNERMSLTIETNKQKIIAVDSNDIILILSKINRDSGTNGNRQIETESQN
ncbi:hypothetical protein HWI79_1061 [Cryptosporidium felis]|nr:hypothetical protein HWI79_1061 [Cryptosporidium felis]